MIWFFFSVLMSAPHSLDTTDVDWQWPVSTRFGVTATFGEYRGMRFHMGLDFSTGGVEGEPIKPARSGQVVKIRAQRRGYGRVLYVNHPNGYQTVYAHLAQFGPKVAAAIQSAGHSPDGYFGTLNLEVDVTADDLIAYSGESGAGLPHLHFEVRAAGNIPVDPLSLPFPSVGKQLGEPVVDGLVVLPLDDDARVNGAPYAYALNGDRGALRAKGKVGIQVLASIHGARNSRLGLRGLRVQVDDQMVGSWLPRRIGFDDYRKAGLVFDQVRSGFGPTQYAHCFDHRASFLPWVDDYAATAPLTITQETTVVIKVMGLDGKWQENRFTLSPDAALREARVEDRGIQPTSLETHLFGDRLLAKASGIDGRLVLPDRLLGLADGDHHLIRIDAPMDIIWRTQPGSLKRTTAPLPRSHQFTLNLAAWQLQAQSLANIPPTAVMLSPPNHRQQSDELIYVSDILVFGRAGLPSKGLRVRFAAGDMTDPGQLGIYAWSRVKSKWRFWGQHDGHGPTAEVDYLTDLVVARDVHPPKVLRPKRHDYFTGPRIVIPVGDRGSGVDGDSVRVFKGSRQIAAEYDSDRRWIILPKDAIGPWTVRLTDRANNTTSVANLRP